LKIARDSASNATKEDPMRKLIVPVAFIGATTAIACSFQAGTSNPNTTPQGGGNAPAAVPTPQPGTAAPGRKGVILGKRTGGLSPNATATATATPTSTPTSTAAPTTTTAPTSPIPGVPGVPVVAAATPFGGPNPDPAGWKGNLYWLAPATQKIPDLSTLQPNGLVFTNTLDVSSRAFTDGFPGVDAAKKENFAIRYEAPLVVDNPGDYEFRLSSDDGAIFRIDNTLIIDNDGARAAVAEKTGPVHLVAGTHVAQVDYFNTTGNVALQLFCKKKGENADKICPTRL
jgi:hypothetical protein